MVDQVGGVVWSCQAGVGFLRCWMMAVVTQDTVTMITAQMVDNKVSRV